MGYHVPVPVVVGGGGVPGINLAHRRCDVLGALVANDVDVVGVVKVPDDAAAARLWDVVVEEKATLWFNMMRVG